MLCVMPRRRPHNYKDNSINMKFYFLCFFLIIKTLAFSQSISQNLDKYFFALNQNQEFNGSILLSENGKITYQKSFGYANFKSKTKNSNTTLINIASVSKTMTAMAVLQLVEKGRLSLVEPFSKYFEEFPYPEITIKQLISHTSGLPDNETLLDSLVAKFPTKIVNNSDIIPALIQYKKYRELRFKPGEKWAYSNIGYTLLALLIEKVGRQPFDEYMKQNIFTPTRMKNTYIQTSIAQKGEKKRCQNYMYNSHYEMKLQQMDTLADWKKFTYNLTGLTGSTNVISNINDLLAYEKAIHSNKLLASNYQQVAFTPVKLNNGEFNKAAQGSYGMGWFIETDSTGNKTVSHSGAAPGVTTYFIRNLTTKQTLIVLQNIQNPMFDINVVLSILKGKPLFYKKSIAYLYAQDAFKNGLGFAEKQLRLRLSDNLNYILTEKDMARVGLEFSRNKKYVLYSLETYRLNSEFFTSSWKAFDDYANALLKNNQKEEAIKMFKKSIELNPNNLSAKKNLELISK